MDSARVFPCMVCTNKHLISRIEKKKKMMNLTDENIDIIQDILGYSCMNQASTSQHYLTTRMQYKTLKFLRFIYTVLYKLFFKHKLYPVYKLPYMEGPLKLFTELCQNIIQYSYVLGEHFLQIATDHDSWRQFNNQAIYLLHRINQSLWSYGLTFHPTKCYQCVNQNGTETSSPSGGHY